MKATGHSLSNLRNIPCIYQKKNGRSYVCFEFDTYEVNIMHSTYLLMYNMYHIHITRGEVSVNTRYFLKTPYFSTKKHTTVALKAEV